MKFRATTVAFFGATMLISASAFGQSASYTPESEGFTDSFPNAGGPYLPSGHGSFDFMQDPSNIGTDASLPELNLHYEAGVWGTNGNEPAAFAHVRANFTPADGVDYLFPPPPLGYARVRCTRDVDPHCACQQPDPDECYYFTLASASVGRLYRLINTSAMMLPDDVDFIPVLVDYRVLTLLNQTGGPGIANLTASVRISYPSGQGRFARQLDCGQAGCVSSTENPAPSTGTLVVPVEVARAEELSLSIDATVFLADNPACAPVTSLPNEPCLVPPYGGTATVLVDPYVYIDPDWEFANLFVVETTSDGVEWFTAERTNLDVSTLGFEGTGGSGGGGPGPVGGAGGSNGTGGTPGFGGNSNPGAGGGNMAEGGGGGCSAVGLDSSSSPPLAMLAFLFVAALMRRTRD